MNLIIGIIVILAGLICWIGQSLSLLSPALAQKLGLCEQEEELDQTLYIIETKSHGVTDMLLTWILPVSGLFMVLDVTIWPIPALIGGGIYLYFPGIIMLNRFFLKRNGKKIGRSSSEKSAYVFGVIWILSAIVMITMAIRELHA